MESAVSPLLNLVAMKEDDTTAYRTTPSTKIHQGLKLDSINPGRFASLMGLDSSMSSAANIIPKIRVTEGKHTTNKQKGYVIQVVPVDDGIQKLIRPTDIIFSNLVPIQKDFNRHTVYPLWAMNFLLEKAYRDNILFPQNSNDNAAIKRGRSQLSDSQFKMPTTLEEFTRGWTLAGTVLTISKHSNQTITQFNASFGGRIEVGNLWGEVSIGTQVGFIIKETKSIHDGFVSYTGEKLGAKTSGTFLQIIPVKLINGGFVYCSRPFNPSQEDVCYYKTMSMTQKTYDYTEGPTDNNFVTGFVDTSRVVANTSRLTFNKLCFGKALKIGTIKESTKTSTDTEIRLALRTCEGYKKLTDNCPCVIEYTHHQKDWVI